MQNIHSHVWDQALHIEPAKAREADLSRGESMDLTVRLDDYLADCTPFDRVAMFGLKGRLTGTWVPDEYVAHFVAKANEREPGKYIGFAGADPTQPDTLDELTHAVEDLALRGLKLGPVYAGFDPRDEVCGPVYAYCQDRALPILFHTGTTYSRVAPLSTTRPWLWDEVAIRYPELRMVLAHVGHPWCDECLVVIRKHPHVYADISALFYRPWQFYNTLITAQEYGVTHKLLFGTDYPFTGGQESIDGLRSVNAVAGADGLPRVTDETIESILARDAFALLGLT